MPLARVPRGCFCVAAISLFAGACSDPAALPGPPPEPDQIRVLAPLPISGMVNSYLTEPIRFLVTKGGEPVADVPVEWQASGGTLDSAVTFTDHAGIASNRWILGTDLGAYSLKAKVRGTALQRGVVSTAIPGPPSVISPGPYQASRAVSSPPEWTPFAVFLTDAWRHSVPRAAATVTWRVVSGPVELIPIDPHDAPSGNGHYTGLRHLGVLGSAVVRASVVGTSLFTDFVVTVGNTPQYPPVPPPPPPPVREVLIWGNLQVRFEFYSGWNQSHPAVDTVDVGTGIGFVHEAYWEAAPLTIMGLPGHPDGLTLTYSNGETVTFTIPGVYEYFVPGIATLRGTVVVRPHPTSGH